MKGMRGIVGWMVRLIGWTGQRECRQAFEPGNTNHREKREGGGYGWAVQRYEYKAGLWSATQVV